MNQTPQLDDIARQRERPLARFIEQRHRQIGDGRPESQRRQKNVNQTERVVSAASGVILAALGVGRRDTLGLAIATVGGALGFRALSGHCHLYQALGVNTVREDATQAQQSAKDSGVAVEVAFLVNRSPQELYQFWRNLENLPRFMSHLESVTRLDDNRSHWIVNAPAIYGGKVEWDSEITEDQPDASIAWRTCSGADVEHAGLVRFEKAPGDRGTHVHVQLNYRPPAGKIGRVIAYLLGEEPEQQLRDDLRKFKRIMEVGEAPSTTGQSRGTCMKAKRE